MIEDFNLIKDEAFDITDLISEQKKLQSEMNDLAELIEECIRQNAHVAQNQEEYQKKYDELAQKFEKAQDKLNQVESAIVDKRANKGKVEAFLAELSKHDIVTEFTEELWFSLLDYITVYSKDDIRVTFQNGTEIKI